VPDRIWLSMRGAMTPRLPSLAAVTTAALLCCVRSTLDASDGSCPFPDGTIAAAVVKKVTPYLALAPDDRQKHGAYTAMCFCI
jgi:hypothetical protein